MKLIAGKINNSNIVYYWKVSDNRDFKIRDYAIVENMNDYDLVKIVGVIETTEKYAKFITNRNANKNVVKIVKRQRIRED